MTMNDLILIINAPSSKKYGFLILEVYYASIRVNKQGKYTGGSISPTDTEQILPVANCNCAFIKDLISKYCYQVSKNGYYISFADFRVLFNILEGNKIFFLDNSDKTLYLIESLGDTEQSRKPKYTYLVNGTGMAYYCDHVLTIHQKQAQPYAIQKIVPTPCLCYSKEENIYSLYFDYAGSKIAYMEKKFSITAGVNAYLKNYQFENEICHFLIEHQFVKLSLSRFIYSGRYSKNDLEYYLSDHGIVLDHIDNSIYPDIKITRSDSGWFDIDLTYSIDGEIIDIASKIKLFGKKNELTHGENKVVIPDSILQARNDIVFENQKLRIHQRHMLELLRIIYDSNSKIGDFFSYSEVSLNLPPAMEQAAFPYQLDGIKWLKFLFLNHFGGCLADDMGLGKTFQIISFLSDMDVKQCVDKILIIVPKSLLTNWQKEFQKFFSDYRVGIYHGESRTAFSFDQYDVVISTYNTVYLDLEKLNGISYSVVVYDEIQIIKNHKSNKSEALKQIRAGMKIGLSGTPMENNISELWNIMDVLNHNLFLSHSAFLAKYNGRNYDELKNILSLFILRRMKQDVLTQLPPKYEQIVYCDMDSPQRKLYNSISYAVKSEIMKLKAFSAPVVLKGLLLLRECCCHPLLLKEDTNVNQVHESCKLDTLKILVDNLVALGHKILIFSQFTAMLHLIDQALDKYRDLIFYLDGKTNDRSKLISQYESASAGIFLISIKAGGVGLNLVSAQDVIIYDPWWNPFVERQAVDRVYRIGQSKTVNVYKLVAANTLEEKIIDMQKMKEEDFDAIINGISNDKNMDLNKILSLL